MKWTLEQIEEMRLGRPAYGDRNKSGSLTWLRTAKDTGGEYSLMHADIGPGYAVFPHYHTVYAETFNVLEGHAPGRHGDRQIIANPGDEIHAPIRTMHGWGPMEEDVKALVELRPAHPGFEKWIMMLINMRDDGLTKPDLQPKSFVHAALFLDSTDTRLGDGSRILNPLFKAVAWFARKAGVERKLEEKYFRPSMLSA